MNRAKNNRYRETENRIKESVLTLLETNRVEKITIKQVCAGAGIHRSSFYLHFSDIYEVMEKIENEFSQKLLQIFLEYISQNGIDRALVQAIFEFVKENEVFYRTFLAGNTEISVFKLAEQSRLAEVMPQIRERTGLQLYDGMDLHMVFFAKGLEGVIRKWVENGCKISPETMTEMVCEEYARRKLADLEAEPLRKTGKGSCKSKERTLI